MWGESSDIRFVLKYGLIKNVFLWTCHKWFQNVGINDNIECFQIKLNCTYGRAVGFGFPDPLFSVFNIFSKFQKNVKGVVLAHPGHQKSSKNIQYRWRTVDLKNEHTSNSWTHFIWPEQKKSQKFWSNSFGARRTVSSKLAWVPTDPLGPKGLS